MIQGTKTFSMAPADERTEAISCILCGETEVRPYWDCDSFTFSKCVSCGHVYQNPQPVFDDLIHRYQEEYFQYELDNDENFFNLMKLGLKDIDFESYERSLGAGSKRVLDVGCATGLLLSWFKGRGWDEQGVEICSGSVKYAQEKRGVKVFEGTLDQAGFPEKNFDLIHSSHVIEHINDPRQYLSDIYRVLKPGGRFVLVTPNVHGFQAKLLNSKWRSSIADHLHLFSVKSLVRIVEKTGFKVLRRKTWGGIAAGIVPGFIKRPIDFLAKKCGFGDVVLLELSRID